MPGPFGPYDRCHYLLCESRFAIVYPVRVSEIVAADLRVVTRGLDVYVCPTHGRLLDDAQEAGWQINLTAEGWLYLERWAIAPLFMAWG